MDSLLLAVQLFRETGEYRYAQMANRIYTNAFRRAQRPNGGAGCDSCLCEYNSELKVLMYEAFFCCTMRYAEGLLCVYENSLFERDGEKLLLFHESCSDGQTTIRALKNDTKTQISTEGEIENVKVYIGEFTEADGKAANGFASVINKGDLLLTDAEHVEKIAGAEVAMSGDSVLLRTEAAAVKDWQNCLAMTEEEVGRQIWKLESVKQANR